MLLNSAGQYAALPGQGRATERDGADIDHAMIALSTYVGHAAVSNTYWYLTAVPDLMAVTAKRFERYASKGTEACNA